MTNEAVRRNSQGCRPAGPVTASAIPVPNTGAVDARLTGPGSSGRRSSATPRKLVQVWLRMLLNFLSQGHAA
jgi:hypothetical protein